MSINKVCQRLCALTLASQPKHVSLCYSASRNITTSEKHDKNYNWPTPRGMMLGKYRLPRDVDPEKYTIEPIETAKTGGRGPDGRIWHWKIGGGLKKKLHMIDFSRQGPKEGEPLVEKVYEVKKDDWRTAHIALVASGNRKRWIVASANMKPGDLIKTSGKLTSMPVRAEEGDAHPIGSLPLGTVVHCLERLPGEGATVARSAGCSGMYLRKVGDKCVVRMPSKRELILTPDCMVTVGQASNPDWHRDKKMSGPEEARLRGIRPSSGWKLRKTGYHGRKVRAPKPAMELQEPRPTRPHTRGFSFT